MESENEDASSASQAISLESIGAEGVQNGDTAASIEPEPSKKRNESDGEFNNSIP